MRNNSIAPSAPLQSPSTAVTPTTASGGTREMAIATPGRMSPMSRRATANEPASPVVAAATRSTSVGDTRPVICELSLGACSSGSTQPSTAASATTVATALARMPADSSSGRSSP